MNERVIYNSMAVNELILNNSAFLYGESVFTSSLIENGLLRFKADHLERLKKSGEFLFELLDLKFYEDIEFQLSKLLKINTQKNYLRITIFKDYLNDAQFSIVLEKRERINTPISLHVKECLKTHGFPSFVKIGSYAYRFMEKKDANKLGFDDVLFIDRQNNIQELSTSNIFFMMEDGEIITPKLAHGILDGIFRRNFLEFLKTRKIGVTEREIKSDELFKVKGAIATNCFSQFRQINKINDNNLELNHFQKLTNDFLNTVGIHG